MPGVREGEPTLQARRRAADRRPRPGARLSAPPRASPARDLGPRFQRLCPRLDEARAQARPARPQHPRRRVQHHGRDGPARLDRWPRRPDAGRASREPRLWPGRDPPGRLRQADRHRSLAPPGGRLGSPQARVPRPRPPRRAHGHRARRRGAHADPAVDGPVVADPLPHARPQRAAPARALRERQPTPPSGRRPLRRRG